MRTRAYAAYCFVNDQQAPPQLNVRAFLAILRRRIRVIVLSVVVIGGGAFVVSMLEEERYSASASLLFRDPQHDQTLFGSQFFADADDDREAATNLDLASLDVVANRTAQEVGGTSGSDVEDSIEVETKPESDVASVTATDRDPEFAARLANSYSRQYIEFRQEADRAAIREATDVVEAELAQSEEVGPSSKEQISLERQLKNLRVLESLQTGNAELVQTAAPPASPSSPQIARNTALASTLALLIGLGLALLRDRLDRRIREPDEIQQIVDWPVLGVIRESDALREEGSNVAGLPAVDLEAFQLLRANLRYFNASREIRSVLVTSAGPGDGKTTVAWNIAAAIAQAGRTAALVEADLRRPSLRERLEVKSRAGLGEVLAGIASLDEATVEVPIDGLGRTVDVVLSGAQPPNPTDLVESERMHSLLRQLEAKYDVVLIDTPPIATVSDAIPLLPQVSGVLVVCRLNQTTRDALVGLFRHFENLGAPTLGVVVNGFVRRRGDLGYGYGYGYEYGSEHRDGREEHRDGREEHRDGREEHRERAGGSARTAPDLAGNGSARVREPVHESERDSGTT